MLIKNKINLNIVIKYNNIYMMQIGGVTQVQSILFDKNKFTEEEAIVWLKKHNYKYQKMDLKKKYYRFRQVSPKVVKADGYTVFRVLKIADGLEFIIAIRADTIKKNYTPKKRSIKKLSKKNLHESKSALKEDLKNIKKTKESRRKSKK